MIIKIIFLLIAVSVAVYLFKRKSSSAEVAAPTNLKGIAMAHSVSLTWTASTDAGAQYNVYGGPSGKVDNSKPINSSPIAVTSYIDNNPNVGVQDYFVTAVVNGHESVPSNLVSIEIVPAPPTNLTATLLS